MMTGTLLLAALLLALAAVATIGAALSTGGRRDEQADPDSALSASRFTIPVSILVPANDGSRGVSETIAALLALNYSELEVIVVLDGAHQEHVSALLRDWQLEAKEFFYRRAIPTPAVRRIYRSTRDARVVVIDKPSGSRGEALNCGINVARYRYVVAVDPGLTFDADALLRMMKQALLEPGHVVAASGHVEYTGTAFGRTASARTLMLGRLAHRFLPGSGAGPMGAIVVWRRDAVLDVQGFRGGAVDPELDLAFRLGAGDRHGRGRFDRGSRAFGRIDALPLHRALMNAARRQRAALQAAFSSLLRRGPSLNARALAYVAIAEIALPLLQVWLIAASVIGAVAGWLPWRIAGFALVFLSFGTAAVTAAALLLRGATPGAPDRAELLRLLLAAPFELVLYRTPLAVARAVGVAMFAAHSMFPPAHPAPHR